MSRKKAADPIELCANHCMYYKPGKSEELRCQGFVAVQKLMAGGKSLSLERCGGRVALDEKAREGLEGRVCAACEFRAADCDYILSKGTAPPCGGFALLSRLLGSGALTLDEIERERK